MDNTTIEQKIDALERRVATLEDSYSHGGLPTTPKSKKTSAREFLVTKEAGTEMLKALTLAYYLEHTDGMQSFNTNDLESVFHSAKEKPPKNLNDVLNKGVARGFLMETREKKESKKAWVVTGTGEALVERK